MQCSCTTLFVFCLSIAGSLLYCIAGFFALEGTLDLLEDFGPEKDFGNPAKDDPPDYWINPTNGQWEARNLNKRGNFVPQVFAGIQWYLIALAVLMGANCFLFLMVATRSKKVVNNRAYRGKRNSLSCIGCTGWLTGYAVFLVALWLVMVSFSVLPLVQYVITRQRCTDLNLFGPGTTQQICIDLVQYGLVFFKEGPDNGYGLICGPGGNYDPQRGDLEGLCNTYYLNFSLYLATFIGACIALLGMVLFAMRFVSIFIYLKIRRYENPEGPPKEIQMNTMQSPEHIFYYPEHSVANPNYEQNVLLDSRFSSHGDRNSYTTPSEATELSRRYDDKSNPARSSRRHASRSASFDSEYPVPPYQECQPPSHKSSQRRSKRDHSRRHRSRSDHDRRSRRTSRRRSRDRVSESESYRSEVASDRSDIDDYKYKRGRSGRRRSYSSRSD